nr:MAG TPA: hypothetical protein [Caudoviricetes sp.]
MISPFPFRSEFEESLNIYPRKIFSLKLEGFLGVLGALAILWSIEQWGKDRNMFHVKRYAWGVK